MNGRISNSIFAFRLFRNMRINTVITKLATANNGQNHKKVVRPLYAMTTARYASDAIPIRVKINSIAFISRASRNLQNSGSGSAASFRIITFYCIKLFRFCHIKKGRFPNHRGRFTLMDTPSPIGIIEVSSSGWCFKVYRYSRIRV